MFIFIRKIETFLFRKYAYSQINNTIRNPSRNDCWFINNILYNQKLEYNINHIPPETESHYGTEELLRFRQVCGDYCAAYVSITCV